DNFCHIGRCLFSPLTPPARPRTLPATLCLLVTRGAFGMQLKTVNWWHQQLADWMFLNPDKPLKDAARIFGTSVNYLYLVKNSDAFKVYWSERRRLRDTNLAEDGAET